MDYSHKQIGWAVILPMITAIFAMFLTYSSLPGRQEFLLVALILLIVLCLFYCLTISVNKKTIKISFGIGLVRKSYKIDDIETARPVRNRWWYGWGIQQLRGGWLYNISGLDAVEVQFKSGRKIRIGTDEPEALLRAINANIETR